MTAIVCSNSHIKMEEGTWMLRLPAKLNKGITPGCKKW